MSVVLESESELTNSSIARCMCLVHLDGSSESAEFGDDFVGREGSQFVGEFIGNIEPSRRSGGWGCWRECGQCGPLWRSAWMI